MANKHDPATEHLELSLIADDANDAVRVLEAPGGSGLTDTLMSEFGHSVKKVRARLKLFDDNDVGKWLPSRLWLPYARRVASCSRTRRADFFGAYVRDHAG